MQEVTVVRNKAYLPLFEAPPRIIRLHGGAGSGKSIAWAQWCIIKSLENPAHRIFCFRKVARTVRASIFRTFVDIINEMGLTNAFKVNKSSYTIESPIGVQIICGGLDDREKVKSIKDPTIIVMEEGTEFDARDFTQLNLRLRKQGVPNHLLIAYNPINKHNWIYQDFELNRLHAGKELCIRTTYKDNKFLPAEYTEELERLAAQSENYHKVYALGERGDIVENLIYPAYEKIEEFPWETTSTVIYGLDFGFTDPAACVRVGLSENKIFLEELVYSSGLTNAPLHERMQAAGIGATDLVYADSAKPGDIQDLFNLGLRGMRSAKKGPGTIQSGIRKVQGYEMFVTSSSSNLISELDQYHWLDDRSCQTLDGKPIDKFNHALDAVRYAVYTHSFLPNQKMIAW